MKTRFHLPLLVAALGSMSAGVPGKVLAMSASHDEIQFVYNSPATVGEAQGILQHLGLLKPGSYKRGTVDEATRDALLTFQRTHALRPTGQVDGETFAQLLQHRPGTDSPTRTPLVLEGVNFETDSSRPTSDSQPVLDKVAGSLKANPDVRVEISGHSDSTGSAAINNRLSKARADAVRDYLTGKGVAASRLETRGYGSSRPIADNGTSEGRARNRRVEMKRID